MEKNMNMRVRLGALSGALVLAACTTIPTGPSVLVLPGTGRSFDQFRNDEMDCRQYAQAQSGGTTANQAGRDAAIASAAVGTAIGAVAGAAIGGRDGAAVGAGTGLLIGSASGSDASRHSAYGTQRQYDNAYIQCMYAKGHRVPVPAGMATPTASAAPPPPPAAMPPPPPPPR